MIELRKDYILDRWSYIALDRGKRPNETQLKSAPSTGAVCFFCPGSEHETPPEIGRIADGDEWKVRWFANKFAAVDPGLRPELKEELELMPENIFLQKAEAFGYHEVIAETPHHDKQLSDLSLEELLDVLRVYKLRTEELLARDGVNYVQIFKNSGAAAGTSLEHSHSQIIAGSLVPKNVLEKLAALKHFPDCPYCQILSAEEKSERHIFSNQSFVSFTTFAPRFNYEAVILPRRHVGSILELSDTELADFAEVLHKLLYRLGRINAPYNYYLHYAPAGEDLHMHMELTPRMNTWAGFELATGSYVISTSPEEAAAFYREEAID
jgi:UDPglucose--hexose-1-phosphate uridylyltransferase